MKYIFLIILISILILFCIIILNFNYLKFIEFNLIKLNFNKILSWLFLDI